jgi:hypothetical protein
MPVTTHSPTSILAQFKVRPDESSRLYYTVRVFALHQDMIAYRVAGISIPKKNKAFCRSFKHEKFERGKWRIKPEVGVLHFYKKFTAPSVVIHECVHAALFYLRRIVRKDVIEIGRENVGRIDVIGREEDLCNYVANLSRQCFLMLYDKGIWKH